MPVNLNGSGKIAAIVQGRSHGFAQFVGKYEGGFVLNVQITAKL
jgi:hypothetical protein